MYDLVSIGDIKQDVFISLDMCKEKCNLHEKNVCFNFGEKIGINVLDQQTAGSAPNVAIGLARMGLKTAVISNMGQDQTYLSAQRNLAKEHVDTRYITPHPGVQSAYCAVLSLSGEKTILVSYIAKTYKLPKRLSTKWLFVSEMGNGYEKLFRQVIRFMKKGKAKLAINPGNQQIAELKPAFYDLIAVTDVLFVNLEEGKRIIKSSRVGIKGLAKKLFNLGPSEIIITDGRNGSYSFDGKTLWHLPMFPGPRVESTGAGDSFAAAYLGARMHGHGMMTGIEWGAVNSAEVGRMLGGWHGQLVKQNSPSLKRGNMQKAKNGGWGGVAPIGYLNKLDDNTIILDPERAPLIRKAWEMVLNGRSAEQTRNTLNNELGFRTVKRKRSGGRPLSYSGMYRMLRNPFYYGWIKRKHDGKPMEYQGAHDPIITKQEFWEVQNILGEPVPKPRTKEFAYTGMIRCGECGCHFTAYEVVKKSGKSYIYYKCTNKKDGIACKQPQLNKKMLEDQIVEILEQMTIPTQFADWAVKWLRYAHENKTDSHSAIRTSLQNAYNDTQKRIDKLTDILVLELINEEEYKHRKAELLEERGRIKSKLDDQEHSSDSWIDRMEKTFAFAKEVNQRFDSDTSPKARRTIVTSLGSNFQIINKELSLDMEPVWKLFSEHSQQLHKDLTHVEVDETGMIKEKTTASSAVAFSWQGRWDSNPDEGFWRPSC